MDESDKSTGGSRINGWYELFSREQIMVNLYEDLRCEPAAMLRRILTF